MKLNKFDKILIIIICTSITIVTFYLGTINLLNLDNIKNETYISGFQNGTIAYQLYLNSYLIEQLSVSYQYTNQSYATLPIYANNQTYKLVCRIK